MTHEARLPFEEADSRDRYAGIRRSAALAALHSEPVQDAIQAAVITIVAKSRGMQTAIDGAASQMGASMDEEQVRYRQSQQPVQGELFNDF